MVKSVIFALGFLFFATAANAVKYTPIDSSVNAEIKTVPGFLTFEADYVGKGEALTGEITVEGGKVSGTLATALSDYTTERDLRDDHMKNKYLEVSKYPKAILKFANVPLAKNMTFKGLLTLHGVTKEVKIDAVYANKKVDGTFEVDLIQYGIQKPSYGGLGVVDPIKVSIAFRHK